MSHLHGAVYGRSMLTVITIQGLGVTGEVSTIALAIAAYIAAATVTVVVDATLHFALTAAVYLQPTVQCLSDATHITV